MMDAGLGSSFCISFVLVVHVRGGAFGVTNSVILRTHQLENLEKLCGKVPSDCLECNYQKLKVYVFALNIVGLMRIQHEIDLKFSPFLFTALFDQRHHRDIKGRELVSVACVRDGSAKCLRVD